MLESEASNTALRPTGLEASRKLIRLEYRVVFDQHGTYRSPKAGVVPRCITNPISDEVMWLLLNLEPDNFERLANQCVKLIKGLPVDAELPEIPDPLEAKEFKASTLDYETRPEQEKGLEEVVGHEDAFCTLLSGMPARNYTWAWYGLGAKGRECVDQNAQMILRSDPNPALAKILGVGVLVYKLDLPMEERDSVLRQVLLVDDDPYFTETASRMYQIPGFLPITREQLSNYPNLQVSKCLEGMKKEVYYGAGLPEAAGVLEALHVPARQVHEVVKLIIHESGDDRPRLMPPYSY